MASKTAAAAARLETIDSTALLESGGGGGGKDDDLEYLAAEEHDDYARYGAEFRRGSELLPESDEGEDDQICLSLSIAQGASLAGTSADTTSAYGQPASPSAAAAACPPGDGGLVYHATLVGDAWRHPKDCDAEGRIKVRGTPTHPHLLLHTPLYALSWHKRRRAKSETPSAPTHPPLQITLQSKLLLYGSNRSRAAPACPCASPTFSRPWCRPPTGAGCSRACSTGGPHSRPWSCAPSHA